MIDISLNPLNNYIEALTENLDKNIIPKEIDLVIDGGAFNGGFGFGILIYLQNLEKLKILKINRISGCSVGALLAISYIINLTESNELLYQQLLKEFRKTCFLKKLPNMIRDFITKNEFDVEILNDKLYITYYDTTTLKQEIISKYKDKEELIQALIRTSYIPFITNTHLQYENKYIDGFSPYIFPIIDNKILFIALSNYKKLTSIFFIKNEVNVWARVLDGILDINKFFSKTNYYFTKSNTVFCSYVNNWTKTDYIFYNFRKILAIFIILFIKFSLFVQKKFPKNSTNFKELFEIIYKLILKNFII